jgi:hypothetical protein
MRQRIVRAWIALLGAPLHERLGWIPIQGGIDALIVQNSLDILGFGIAALDPRFNGGFIWNLVWQLANAKVLDERGWLSSPEADAQMSHVASTIEK